MIEEGLQKYKKTIRKLILNFNDYVTISGTKVLYVSHDSHMFH